MPTNPLLATRDPQLLIARIKNGFPDLIWGRYKFIDLGWDHEIIQLDEKYICRFPNSYEYLPMLRYEIDLLTFLATKTKSQIPHYSFIALDHSFGGYEMLPGVPLSPELFNSIGSRAQDIIAKNIADFLTDFHSIDVVELTKFNISAEKPFGSDDDIHELALTHLKSNLSTSQYAPIQAMLEDIDKATKYEQPGRLTHGDIAPKHLIWDHLNEILGFIDFSDRCVSDPALDFAELYTYGEKFVNKVYSF